MTDFSKNIDNQRFGLIYDELTKSNKIKGKSDLADKLETYNHVINNVLKGDRSLTVKQINLLVEHFDINANFVFGCSEQLYNSDSDEIPTHSLAEKIIQGRNNITLVPDKASAGYALAVDSKEYLEQFKRFSVPGLEGPLLAFEISGDSMLPHITNGDLVICEALERNQMPRDNGVYVVVTDTVVTKRIRRIKDSDSNQVVGLELLSDNEVYRPYQVDLEEIRQILKVKARLTAHGLA